jgi:hypothetical protein
MMVSKEFFELNFFFVLHLKRNPSAVVHTAVIVMRTADSALNSQFYFISH